MTQEELEIIKNKVDDLGWDFHRLSEGGQEVYVEICRLLGWKFEHQEVLMRHLSVISFLLGFIMVAGVMGHIENTIDIDWSRVWIWAGAGYMFMWLGVKSMEQEAFMLVGEILLTICVVAIIILAVYLFIASYPRDY